MMPSLWWLYALATPTVAIQAVATNVSAVSVMIMVRPPATISRSRWGV